MADAEAVEQPEPQAGGEQTSATEEGSISAPEDTQVSAESDDANKDAEPPSLPPETEEKGEEEKAGEKADEEKAGEEKQEGAADDTEQQNADAAAEEIPPPLSEADADAPAPANAEAEQAPGDQTDQVGAPEEQEDAAEELGVRESEQPLDQEGDRQAATESPKEQEWVVAQEEEEGKAADTPHAASRLSPGEEGAGSGAGGMKEASVSSKGRRDVPARSRAASEKTMTDGSEMLRGASSSRMDSGAGSRVPSKKSATPNDEERALRTQLEEYKSRCRIVEDDRAELERLVRELRLKADAEGQARQKAEAAKESAEEELRYKATVKVQAESAAQSQITQLESVIQSLKLQLGEIQDQENIVTELRDRVDKAEREISEKDLQFTRVQAEMERRVQQQYQLLMRNRSYMESVGRRKINISSNLQNALSDMRSKRKEQEEMGSMLEGLIKRMDSFIAEESSRMNDLSDIKNTLSTLRRDDLNLETLEQLEVKLRQEKDGAQNEYYQERRLEDELLAQMLPRDSRDSNVLGGAYPPSYNPSMAYGMPEVYKNGMNKMLEGNREVNRYSDNMEYMGAMMRNEFGGGFNMQQPDFGAPSSNAIMNGMNGRLAPNGGGAWPMFMPPYAGGPLGDGMEYGYGVAKAGYPAYGQYGGEPMGRGFDNAGEVEMINGGYSDMMNARPPSGKPLQEERMVGRGQVGGAFKFPPIGAGSEPMRQDAKGGSKERKLRVGKTANEGSERERLGGKDSRQQVGNFSHAWR
mmetsp:Transcript_14607/g.49868  ORF Transcript_14607/g.49868 Transcript_14607/m.49868 type:complete len:754 (-) Transcript_14607:129-2390(-)